MQTTEKLSSLSKHLQKAEETRAGVEPLTSIYPGLTVEEAYQVQLATITRKLKEGKSIVGKKIGLTSKAMQELLGVDQPDFGYLLDEMVVGNERTISLDRVLQPRVEAEIAFVLKNDLRGPHVTVPDVLVATDYVTAALEVVDSRIQDWKIQLADTIADNASSGLYVLGKQKVDPLSVDFAHIGTVFYRNGKIENTGVGAAAFGHPATCVAWLANKLSEFDESLKTGEVILSGALSAAVTAEPGDAFAARFAHLGSVCVQFANE